jgi:hypothetical protein
MGSTKSSYMKCYELIEYLESSVMHRLGFRLGWLLVGTVALIKVPILR